MDSTVQQLELAVYPSTSVVDHNVMGKNRFLSRKNGSSSAHVLIVPAEVGTGWLSCITS